MASLAGLLLVGGAVAAYLESGEQTASTPPPVIRADEAPVKVEAQAEPAAEPGAGDVVYTPPTAEPAGTDERLVDSAEEPREVARVVLPPPQAAPEEPLVRPLEEPPGQSPAEPPAVETVPAQTSPSAPIGPRKVRTLVVRPDGTIVASSEAPAAPAPEAAEPPALSADEAPAGDPLRPNPVRTTAITSPVQEDASPDSLIADESPGPGVVGGAAVEEPPPAPDTATTDQTDVPRARPEPATAPEQQVALQEPGAPEIPAEAAATEPEAPIDLLAQPPASEPPAAAPAPEQPPAETAARTPPAQAPADGYVVQLSSQRSDAAARSSFAALKRQFASVLGPYEPNIQQADLGAKGIYYRVRIGPMATRAEAIRVCESLRAAGGTCFVGR